MQTKNVSGYILRECRLSVKCNSSRFIMRREKSSRMYHILFTRKAIQLPELQAHGIQVWTWSKKLLKKFIPSSWPLSRRWFVRIARLLCTINNNYTRVERDVLYFICHQLLEESEREIKITTDFQIKSISMAVAMEIDSSLTVMDDMWCREINGLDTILQTHTHTHAHTR